MTARRYLLFALGQLGVMALTRYLFGWLVSFAKVEQAGAVLLSASFVGALFFGFRIFDGVTDPVAGMIGDGWVRRGRERRTLLWFAFPIAPLGLVLTFLPDFDMSIAMRWIVLTSGLFLFFVGYTLYAIPFWSLIHDYGGDDARVRSKLSNMLGLGVLLATGVGFVVSPMLVERHGYLAGAASFAVPCALLMVCPYFSQPKQPPPSTPVASDRSESSLGNLKLALVHRNFLAVVVLFAGGQMSFTVMTAAAPFIAVELLGGTKGDVALLLGPFLATAVPCFFLIPRLSARFGWERTIVVATVLLGVVYGTTGLLGAALVGTPLVTAMILFAFGGPMAAVLLGVEGEAIAASARESGGSATSVYFGVYNMIVKAANGLAIFLAGLLATASATQGTIAVRGMGFTAGALLVLGVIGYWRIRRR